MLRQNIAFSEQHPTAAIATALRIPTKNTQQVPLWKKDEQQPPQMLQHSELGEAVGGQFTETRQPQLLACTHCTRCSISTLALRQTANAIITWLKMCIWGQQDVAASSAEHTSGNGDSPQTSHQLQSAEEPAEETGQPVRTQVQDLFKPLCVEEPEICCVYCESLW